MTVKFKAFFAVFTLGLFLFGCVGSKVVSTTTQEGQSAVFVGEIVSATPVENTAVLPLKIKCPYCNVLVVSFDALQAAHVGHLGYKKATGRDVTPGIDKIASDGFSFSNAISSAPWTVPSYMSWFTSSYPSQHKVLNKFSRYVNETDKTLTNFKELSPDMITMAQFLKSDGFVTGAFTGDAGVSAVFGYDAGFDVFYDEVVFGGLEYSTPLALEWLKNNSGKRFFMFYHGYDSHGQYEPNYTYKYVDFEYNGPFNGSKKQQRDLRELGLKQGFINLTYDDVRFWRAVYDEKINLANSKFLTFLEEFEKMGLMNNTIIIISSDHGTEFYEHKRFDHGFSLYDELVHVPLVFRVPGAKGGGRIIDSQVRTIDILPTLLDLLNIEPDEKLASQMEGVSLAPLLRGEKNDLQLTAFTETDYRHYTFKRGIQKPNGWKFIYTLEDGSTELYNLKEDPLEKKNLVEEEPRIAYELEQELFAHLNGLGREVYRPWITSCVPVYGDQCK